MNPSNMIFQKSGSPRSQMKACLWKLTYWDESPEEALSFSEAVFSPQVAWKEVSTGQISITKWWWKLHLGSCCWLTQTLPSLELLGSSGIRHKVEGNVHSG